MFDGAGSPAATRGKSITYAISAKDAVSTTMGVVRKISDIGPAGDKDNPCLLVIVRPRIKFHRWMEKMLDGLHHDRRAFDVDDPLHSQKIGSAECREHIKPNFKALSHDRLVIGYTIGSDVFVMV